MKTFEVKRTINAPVDDVFRCVADMSQFSQAIPHIIRVEMLTQQQVGLGTRFRETRLMKGREVSTELEVTEYTENDRIRLIADAGGTIWDTVFVVRTAGQNRTELTMTMVGNAYKLVARFMNLLIGPMVLKAVESDLDAVKAYCEERAKTATA